MIRKLMISLLGIALARILFILAAINLINTLVFHKLEPSIDLSLLDQIYVSARRIGTGSSCRYHR